MELTVGMERMVKTVRPGQKVTPVLRVQLVHGAKRVTRARRAMPMVSSVQLAHRVPKATKVTLANRVKKVIRVTKVILAPREIKETPALRVTRAMPANRVLKVILERRAHKAKRAMLVTMGERLSYRKLRCISSGATGVMLLGITSLHYLT